MCRDTFLQLFPNLFCFSGCGAASRHPSHSVTVLGDPWSHDIWVDGATRLVSPVPCFSEDRRVPAPIYHYIALYDTCSLTLLHTYVSHTYTFLCCPLLLSYSLGLDTRVEPHLRCIGWDGTLLQPKPDKVCGDCRAISLRDDLT
jgi:hypothetical protein